MDARELPRAHVDGFRVVGRNIQPGHSRAKNSLKNLAGVKRSENATKERSKEAEEVKKEERNRCGGGSRRRGEAEKKSPELNGDRQVSVAVLRASLNKDILLSSVR
ncbi:hypothetical protein DMN91_007938 [Ooceraea biroi]|uniref:Uncharacterized protein n=1 Tax=Ooceraea biroi TaxID=2015173 RepID=A0A026VX44_OOCBI|nr:hypothetical protein X777_13878 [Ooceraea biroi]RLU19381.1 hypothetical protein DMN91_007938 [Ooceraea biroi]